MRTIYGTVLFKHGGVEAQAEYIGALFPLTEEQEKEYFVLREEAWQDNNYRSVEPSSADLLIAPGVHRRQWFSEGYEAREEEVIFVHECAPSIRSEVATRLFAEV